MTLTTMSALHPPMHPGAFLREIVLPGAGLPVAAIADRLGISRQVLEDVLAEEARVTGAMALRLAKLFGGEAQFWLDLQSRYDILVAERDIAEELGRIEPIEAA